MTKFCHQKRRVLWYQEVSRITVFLNAIATFFEMVIMIINMYTYDVSGIM